MNVVTLEKEKKELILKVGDVVRIGGLCLVAKIAHTKTPNGNMLHYGYCIIELSTGGWVTYPHDTLETLTTFANRHHAHGLVLGTNVFRDSKITVTGGID